MEDEFLYTNGISTKEAMERLVQIGRKEVESWDKQRNPFNYGCSVDKILCRNLFIFSIVSAVLLLIGAVTIENHLSISLLLLTTLHLFLLFTAHYVQWKMCRASSEEKKRKATKALDYVSNISSGPFPYAPLGEPLSNDMLTQAVLRDGHVVAVPRLLLVEGDVILLRPSQAAPCNCNGEVVKMGACISEKVEVDQETGAAIPLDATRAIATSTPLADHLSSVSASRRSFTTMDYQLHYCLHKVAERALLPVIVFMAVSSCAMRFFLDGSQSLFSTRFVFAIPSLIVLSLTAPTYFFILRFVHQRGNAAVCDVLKTTRANAVKDYVSLFGNLTGTSFFDQKGLLSPMNPCLDKVVFFRPSDEEQSKEAPALEIMDLSSEQLIDGSWSVDFDDPNWSRFESNLRAIGQCLLLNRCDPKFPTFLDHLSAVATTVPRTVATAFRWCSCVFPQLIGFKSSSANQFQKLPNVLGFYQRRPGEAPLPGLTKHQTPLEMAYCTVHADDRSLYYHLSCQGTAILVLEACSHVWDGEQLTPITERILKSAIDFYQRHSVTGYCLALSYRAVGMVLDDTLKDRYFEVPLLHRQSRKSSLARTHSIDSSQNDPFFDQTPLKTADEVIQRWFTGHVLCGMVVTQYEVMPQAVQLIDQLETLCVRFVYFSRENEVRSRVFAEKLGLEAGWNCHVSLAEVDADDNQRTLKDYFLSRTFLGLRSPAAGSPVLKHYSRSDEELHLDSLLAINAQGSPAEKKPSQQPPTKMVVLPNKARLPTGIAAVRPHLEQVDNVPLLVGLITDCTPEANLQMLEIMQEYGEMVLAVGSSLSIVNTRVFLQANVSISVLPVGDWQCSMSSEPNWQTAKNAADCLMGIASDFQLRFEQLLALPKLIVACRHRCASVRGSLAFLFFASTMLSISLLVTATSFLPLLFDFEQVFLTTFVQLPLLTLGSVFTPFRPKSNVIRISSKNSRTVPRQHVKWALLTFFVGFFPSSLFLVLLFFLKLVRNSTLACSFSDVVCAVATENVSDIPLSTMAIRHVIGLHQSVYLCALSSAWVFPLSSLWNDNPFFCLPWTASCLLCLALQVVFSYACGVFLHEVLSVISVIVLLAWTSVILLVNELVKRRSIRDFTREQRRTKLGFDTKLGMNSPY
uniref:Cation_ATPase_C domain-containing protein n=1 Tax=Haemonchus contortus TaxID=6289 RepID=A0A7I4XTZ8_HAECO